MEQLKKKYGLFTAICMVIGIVIGSGIFFKAQDVLAETNGDAIMGTLAWIIGGLVLIAVALAFAVMATKYEKVGGVVDYAEATCGSSYAYYVGWFTSVIYYPAMTSVLAWVSARYTMVAFFGVSSGDPKALFSAECITIAAFYLIAIYFINSIAPKFAGKLQVSTTIIKLIPLLFIAIVGTVIGLANGTLSTNIVETAGTVTSGEGGGLFAAVCCTAFAYEGWIIATAINAEIKDAKKNLPIALTVGAFIIVIIYVLYFVGVLGLAKSDVLMAEGTSAAFDFFGPVISTLINIFVIVSCLGTLNGLMLGCTRGFYSLSARSQGIRPVTFGQIDRSTNVPHNSASLALFICVLWFVYFIGGQFFGWFGDYAFDSSELPVITIYPIYIPILIRFMVKATDESPLRRFVIPSLAIVASLVMVVASVFRHKIAIVWYLIVFVIVMGIGAIIKYFNSKNTVSANNDTEG